MAEAVDGNGGLYDLPAFLALDVELDLGLVDVEVPADDGDQFLLHLLHDSGRQLGTVLHENECASTHPRMYVNWFLPSQKLLRGVRTGIQFTKVYDNAQTPCARMPARKDVSEQTKERLRATRAALDRTSLLHEIFLCQDQLDEIARRRQPPVIKKRGSYATISYDGGDTI